MAVTAKEAHKVGLPAALKPLVESIEQLFQTHKYSDLVIKSEGHTYERSAHKFLICAYSDVLAATLHRGAQLEEKTQKNEITLDDDPQVIEAMLHYMYKLDYGDSSIIPESVSAIVMDVKLFTIADKYNIKTLMDLAAEKFEIRCEKQWAEPAFADAIQEVYTLAPDHDRRLKRTIIDTVREHAFQLFDNHNNIYPDFERTAREIADFSADMCRSLAIEGKKGTRTYKCPIQGEVFHIDVPTPKLFVCPRACCGAQTDDWWNDYIHD